MKPMKPMKPKATRATITLQFERKEYGADFQAQDKGVEFCSRKIEEWFPFTSSLKKITIRIYRTPVKGSVKIYARTDSHGEVCWGTHHDECLKRPWCIYSGDDFFAPFLTATPKSFWLVATK